MVVYVQVVTLRLTSMVVYAFSLPTDCTANFFCSGETSRHQESKKTLEVSPVWNGSDRPGDSGRVYVSLHFPSLSARRVAIWQMSPGWLFWQLTESSHMIPTLQGHHPSQWLPSTDNYVCLQSLLNLDYQQSHSKVQSSPIVLSDWHLVFWGGDNCGQLLMSALTDLPL